MLDVLNYGHIHNLQNVKRSLDWNSLGNRTFFFVSMGKKVAFSDEKKLISTDQMVFDITTMTSEKTNFFFSKRHFRGGSMIVQAGFTACGTTPVKSMRRHLNSESYIDMLAKNLLPAVPLITGEDYLFRQDIVSCHVSRASRSSGLSQATIFLLFWLPLFQNRNNRRFFFGVFQVKQNFTKKLVFNVIKKQSPVATLNV